MEGLVLVIKHILAEEKVCSKINHSYCF